MEELNWNKKNRFAIQDFAEEIQRLTKEIVKVEMKEISKKLDTLQTMGVVSDSDVKLQEIKKKITELS
jgi:hypothetical protein